MEKALKFEYKISLIYLVLGVVWIIFSDQILNYLVPNQEVGIYIQTVKGIFYVVITAFLLFFLARNHTKKNREIREKLRDSNEKYKALYENAPLAYQSLDMEGFILDVNPQWLQILGYQKEEVIGKWFGDFLKPDFASQFKSEFDEFKEKGFIRNIQFQLRKKDGQYIDVSYEGNISYQKNGRFGQTYCTFKDVTEENNAKQALLENQQKFQALFIESISVMLLIDYKTGQIIDANNAAIHFYGYDLDTLKNMRIQDINTLNDEQVETKMTQVTTDQKHRFRFKHQLASGELRDVDVHATTIILGSRHLIYSIIFDVTERLQTERELLKAKTAIEESEEKFKAAFYTSPDAVTISDMKGYYVDINKGFADLTGYTSDDVLSKRISILRIWQNPEDQQTLLKALRDKGEIKNLETVFRMKDGSLKTALISSTFIQINGKPHILSVTKDITDRKQIENDLLKAKERAEESDRLKSAFMANMSHEIRTPLNGVLGFAGILKDEELPSLVVQNYAEIISKSGQRLLNLINNILDISKIESGSMTLDKAYHDPIHMLDEVVDLFRMNAQQKHLKIRKSIPYETTEIYSDQSKIIQVLSNLVSNAVKFSQKGFIIVGYKLEAENIIFFVKDTGPGIKPDIVPRLFNRFYQVSNSLTRGHEGSGLGLFLCKSLIELLGGEIWVESEEGVGSAFKFKLPVK